MAADQEQIEQIRKTIKELQDQIASLTKQKTELTDQLSSAKQDSSAAREALSAANQRIGALEQQLAEAQKTAPSPTGEGGLAIGGSGWVRKAGGMPLNRRDAPGLQSNVHDSLPIGIQVTLLEGPRPADGFTWWRVKAADGREGWVAGEELVTHPE